MEMTVRWEDNVAAYRVHTVVTLSALRKSFGVNRGVSNVQGC